MPSRYGPSPEVVKLIAGKGGSIWSTLTDPTAGGTAVAETELEQHRVPDRARTLLGWRPMDYPTNQDVAESLASVFTIDGTNFNHQPQEVLCGTVGDSILLNGGVMHRLSEYYDVFAPVDGGETINVNIEPLDAIAGNRRAAAELTWTTVPLGVPVIKSQCSREVATGTTTGGVAGTTLDITDTHYLVEVGGVITHAAITIEEPLGGSLQFKCTNWDPIQETQVLLEFCGAIGDLTADQNAPLAGVARRVQRLKFKTTRSTVTTLLDLDNGPTGAGQFAHMLRWI